MEKENRFEKCSCVGTFFICVVLLVFLMSAICAFCVFLFKFDAIKASHKMLAFLLVSFGIVLICFSVSCISAIDIYVKCKKISVLKELFFDFEANKKFDSTPIEITRKALDKDKYKAFVNAVADL